MVSFVATAILIVMVGVQLHQLLDRLTHREPPTVTVRNITRYEDGTQDTVTIKMQTPGILNNYLN